jgi:hypothetical protein
VRGGGRTGALAARHRLRPGPGRTERTELAEPGRFSGPAGPGPGIAAGLRLNWEFAGPDIAAAQLRERELSSTTGAVESAIEPVEER